MTRTHLGSPALPPRSPHEPSNLRFRPQAFYKSAREDLANATQRHNLRHATTSIRAKRAHVVGELDDWEALREAGSAIKQDVAARLPELLEQFEASVTNAGGTVHWARDAAEANQIALDLVRATGEREVIKIKSMATQEIAFNEACAEAGIAAIETDLAELIVQLGEDYPSHILVPAIHRNRAEIRDIFVEKMPTADSSLQAEPAALAEAARRYLREKFMTAKVAISGANFGIADTGTISIVESEGNGRMCLTMPETLISVMGIEKILPTFADLEVFLQLLPRSSTGERMNPYTSLWSGVTPGDGPQNFHVILLDNGRSAALADPTGREALKCIRCSACLNVCPVYERAGGHAYGSVYPGPIGAIITPQLAGMDAVDDVTASLPFASSLCGRCDEVCPVKIPITDVLLELRHQKIEKFHPKPEAFLMGPAAALMSHPTWWNRVMRMVALGRVLGGFNGQIDSLPFAFGGWSDSRNTKVPPKKSFRQWFDSDEAKKLLIDARQAGITPNRVGEQS